MNDTIRRALSRGHLIDITTTGRVTGRPRRIEIVFHVWLRNLEADPRLTFHLKSTVQADLAATARIITDPAERREVLGKIARVWRRDAEEMIAHSPLIEVTIEGYTADHAA
jgi:hypothetical protein